MTRTTFREFFIERAIRVTGISAILFVALIFFYAWRMNKMDQKFDVHEHED